MSASGSETATAINNDIIPRHRPLPLPLPLFSIYFCYCTDSCAHRYNLLFLEQGNCACQQKKKCRSSKSYSIFLPYYRATAFFFLWTYRGRKVRRGARVLARSPRQLVRALQATSGPARNGARNSQVGVQRKHALRIGAQVPLERAHPSKLRLCVYRPALAISDKTRRVNCCYCRYRCYCYPCYDEY